jgi:H+/Cl- antiporter ClcA
LYREEVKIGFCETDGPLRFNYRSMEFVKIVVTSILAAILYGILHDQITARICVEYFTIGHPPVFHTDSPTLLGLGWGVIATWWVGFFLGIPLAYASRRGQWPKLTARQLIRPLAKLLIVMALLALIAGCTGCVLTRREIIALPDFVVEAIPPNHRLAFVADWWSHSMSYLAGFVGGVVLIISSWRRRKKAAAQMAFPSAC